jgi:putative transposase
MTTSIKTYKYRIYPNKSQEILLRRIFAIARHTYNSIALEAQQRYERGEKFDAYAIRDLFCQQRHDIADLQLIPATTIDDLVRRYQKALKAFWRKNAKAGFPKFKDDRTFKGLVYVYRGGVKLIEDKSKVGRLRLWKVDGVIRVQMHRPLPTDGKIKQVVITRDSDQWHACFQIELPAPKPLRSANPAVGIDIGLVHLLTLSDKTTIDHPKWYEVTQAKRAGYQIRIDRQRRANNPQNYSVDGTAKQGVFVWHRSARMKANEKLARKVDRKAKNQRWYFWHTVTTWLVNTYGVIVLEDLNLDFMLKNGYLARRAHDAGLGTFMTLLESKAAAHGVEIIKVNPAYTSQECSTCGHIEQGNRANRETFECLACGHKEDADVNAARNILRRGNVGKAFA